MNSTERSTRVFAGIAAFLVVFSAPRLLLEMFDDSFPTVLLGLTALAAAWAVVCLVSLRVKRLEMQARHLQAQLDDLAKQTGVLP
mgnify:CR=1 FL=1